MPHFMQGKPGFFSERKEMTGVWQGVKVMVWMENGQTHLVVMPTPGDMVVRIGTLFVPLSLDIPVLIPYVEIPGKYKDVRDQVRRRWWVSANTIDPYHILTDWEPGSSLVAVEVKSSVIDKPN